MAWQDSIKEGAYISPLGFRRTFIYEDVSKEFDKKTTAFDFPAINGTYVQDLGKTGYRYPLRFIFSGDNYHAEALAFEAALSEKGIGRIEHPIYGTVNVIPFGRFIRRDDLKTAANQAIIEITLYETIFEIYAGSITDFLDALLAAINLYNEAASGQLNDEIIVDKVTESSSFKSFYGRLIANATDKLKGIASTDSSINTQFHQVGNSMQSDLNSVEEPDVKILGTQTTTYVQLPARATSVSIDDRIDAYSTLVNPIIDLDNIIKSGYNFSADNEFHSQDFHAASYITGIILSAVNTAFQTKPEAFEVIDNIITVFEQWTNWRDNNYKNLNKEDTGDLYAALQDSVAITIGFLIQISFSLQTEKFITLTRSRSVIDLVAQLYGSVDDKLDFFINTNNLTGSEILELPKGRQIVYYV